MTYAPTAPPALPGTLGDIISKVRRITKSPSQNQITDEQIVQYINTYYLYDFPAELRLKDSFSNWSFTTAPYQETYPLPTDTFITVEPPLYINGYQSYFTQSQDNFYQLYPRLGLANNVITGNGTPGPYSFTLTNAPVLSSNFVIGAVDSTGAAASARDFPIGTYQGALAGVGIVPNPPFPAAPTSYINYVTGDVVVTFVNAIPAGEPIKTQVVPYQPSVPVGGLFFNNTLYLRPIPNGFYQVTIAAFVNPFACPNGLSLNPPTITTGAPAAPTRENVNPAGVGFASENDTPQIKQWWQLVAWGTSIKILEDRGDLENIQRIMPMYEDQKRKALRRTLVEMANERTMTIYSEQTRLPTSNFFNQF